jgi:hypothetical protein
MKSPSEQDTKNVEQLVNAALDQSVSNLSADKVVDISQARHKAINALYQQHSQGQKAGLTVQISQMLMQPFPRVAVPVAAAVLIAVSFNYHSTDVVPALPLAMVTEEVPTEDLTLLEDLEFVTWLAENEQEALL